MESADPAEQPDDEPARQPWWRPLLGRFVFFARAFLETVLDGVYLLLVYFWTVLVNAVANHFDNVEGFERVLLEVTRYVFIVPPIGAAAWFVVVGLLGVLRRTWEKRDDD